MKTIKSIIQIALLCALTSCEGFLDTRIDTYTTADRVQTRYNTLWSFANAFYAPLQSGYTVLDNNLFAAASDEAVQTSLESDVQYFNNGSINSSVNPLSYLYDKYYEGIRAALFFLDYAEDGEMLLAQNRDTSGVTNMDNRISYQKDVRSLKWYRAEAHVALAYYYSELIKMYGGVPIITNTLDKEIAPGHIERSSYDQVVEHIVSLIDSQIDSLQEDWATHSDNVAARAGRFDKATAMAIKVRTLLYAASPRNNPEGAVEKWERAARAAADLLAFRNYSMPVNRNYGSYFVGANPLYDRETIYAIRMSAGNALEKANYPITTPGGNSGVTPTQNLVSSYEVVGSEDPVNPYNNRDPRLAATIVYNGCRWNGRDIDLASKGTDDMSTQNATRTGYYLRKFMTDNLNLQQNATAQHMWVLYRHAELLLNYAEAMNEAYGPDAKPEGYALSAREALTEVRNSASTSLPKVTATDKEQFRKAIKHERRVELAFEDHRYWDLIRWLDAEDVLNSTLEGVKISKTATGTPVYRNTSVEDRTFLERNYYLPFAMSEVMNSDGTLTQNPGY